MNEIPLAILLLALAALIALSAFFSASGTSLATLNRQRLTHLSHQGHRGARRASALLDRPAALIALVLTGHHLANLLAAAIAVVIAIRITGRISVLPVLMAVLLLGPIVVVCVELLPRAAAARHPERMAFPASAVLNPLLQLSQPLLWLGRIMRQVLRRSPQHRGAPLSADALHHLLSEASPLMPLQHQRLLRSVISLVPVTVDALMVPRNEIIGLDLEASDAELIARIRQAPCSQLPVYRKEINHVIGIISWRAACHCLGPDDQLDRDRLERLVEQPYFIPEGTPLHVQLTNFLTSERRLGLVVDEYGEVQGLLTLEDLLAEIATELAPTPLAGNSSSRDAVVMQNDGSYLLAASTPIRAINKRLDWQLPTSGPRTLNGLLLEHLESFPAACAGLRIGPYHFEIAELNGTRIQQVRAWQQE